MVSRFFIYVAMGCDGKGGRNTETARNRPLKKNFVIKQGYLRLDNLHYRYLA